MKKLMLIMVAVLGMAWSVNAEKANNLFEKSNTTIIKSLIMQEKGVVLRTTQTLCNKDLNEKIILKGGGGFALYQNSSLVYEGRYTIEGSTVWFWIDGKKQLYAQVSMNSSKTNVYSLTFEGVKYTPCS